MVEIENEQKLIFSGRSVEEALQNAKDKLGMDSYAELSYKVVEGDGKKKFGLFGGKKKEVRIQILFNKDDASDEADDRNFNNEIQHDVKKIVADVWGSNENGNRGRGRKPTDARSNNRGRQNRTRSGGQVTLSRENDHANQRRRRKHNGSGNQPVNNQDMSHIQPVSSEVLKCVKDQMNTLFQKMGMDLAVEVEPSNKNPSIIRVTPKGEDQAWLFGRRDENLRSLEELTIKMIKTRFGEDQKCRLYFVGQRNFRRHRPRVHTDDEAFTQKVGETIQRVKKSGEAAKIGPFNAYERRLIHRCVSKEDGLTSTSTGEGSLKQVTIQKQS